eukprot:147146-Pyramimonas_sp.AAC.1
MPPQRNRDNAPGQAWHWRRTDAPSRRSWISVSMGSWSPSSVRSATEGVWISAAAAGDGTEVDRADDAAAGLLTSMHLLFACLGPVEGLLATPTPALQLALPPAAGAL